MGRPARRGLLAAFAALTMLVGCTYSDRETGLFGRSPAPDPSSRSSAEVPNSSARIPVLGEATWTAADTRGIPIRIAVHGVRRVAGGTVLDWSITALSAPDRVPGELVEGGLPLDLFEETDVLLVDAAAGRVYRPLVARDRSRRCLCSPVWLAQENLALDTPRLLQVTFPVLPDDIRVIDVSVTTAPVFARIPVTPVGQISAPIAETDLARPVEAREPRRRTPDFSLPSGQTFAIEVDGVYASGTLTSVVWTLESITRGPGPGPGLAPELTRNDTWRLRPLRVTPGAYQAEADCLCSDPARWRDHLEEPGRRLTVVTNLGEMPRGTTSVDVVFPGVAPLRGVRVTTASDGAFRTGGLERGPRETWSYRPNRPQPGWRVYSWPTPVPVVTEDAFTVTVGRIVS